jgi:hypothetical protein
MYEIYSAGAMPYEGVENRKVGKHVGRGIRLEKPAAATDEMWALKYFFLSRITKFNLPQLTRSSKLLPIE